MSRPGSRNAKRLRFALLMFWPAVWLAHGCGSGSSGGSDPAKPDPTPTPTVVWKQSTVKALHSGGATSPHVCAVAGRDGTIHIAFFSDGGSFAGKLRYRLNYLTADPSTGKIEEPPPPSPEPPETGGEGLDNCRAPALTLDLQDRPVLVYQGGKFRPMGAEEQSDVMLSIFDGAGWSEYTAAIGYVERNPYYDGLARPDLTAAVDSAGDIHIGYQFFYEGIDADNMTYPDMAYVYKRADALDEPTNDADYAALEEIVHGNEFSTYGVQNSVGYHCRLVIDGHGQPVLFYAEQTENAKAYKLWTATRNGPDDWQREVIEELSEGWEIGAISAALSPTDGSLAVAYQLKCHTNKADEGDHLKFAQTSGGKWSAPVVVDQSSWCGGFCSLAFDRDGQPAIAYYDDHSHAGKTRGNLNLAYFNGTTWKREVVAEAGDIGHDNSLWFDAENRAQICSYSTSTDAIYIFTQSGG